MIAEAGLFALWLAAALALLQVALGVRGLRSSNSDSSTTTIRFFAIAQAAFAALAFALLVWLFLRTDLSVALVAAHSNLDRPWLDKLAATWGNRPGAILLWAAAFSLAGGAVALHERDLPQRTLLAALTAQGAITLGLHAFLLFASNPFARLSPVLGSNPMVQDPGLALPLLALGYSGLVIAFSIAIGALITRHGGAARAKAIRPWILAAWIFLTLNLVAADDWSYTGFSPWLVATILLHALIVRAMRDAARAWTVGRLAIPVIAMVAAAIALLLLAPETEPLPAVTLVIAVGAALASVIPLAGRNPLRIRLRTWGAAVVHFGIAISLVGLAAEDAFTEETMVTAAPGDEVAVGPWRVRFVGIEPVAGPGWTALQARLTAAHGDGIVRLTPQARTASNPAKNSSQADVASRLDGQLSAVIGQPVTAGRWPLRLIWKPMVTLIWLGGLMAALGGLLALIGHARREARD